MGTLAVKMIEAGYPEDKDIRRLTAYVVGEGENKDEEIVLHTGAHGVKKEHIEAADQFIAVQRAVGKDNNRRAYHMSVSFEKDFKNRDVAIQALEAIGQRIFQRHQVIYGVHGSTDNLHANFAIHAVSYVDGRKWHTSRPEFQKLKEDFLDLANEVMHKNGLPALTLSKRE